MAATTLILYKRGNQYVEDLYKDTVVEKDTEKKATLSKRAHGLVGEMWVHGLCFDTIERMDGYVHLKGGQDYIAGLYWHPGKDCYVINPWFKGKTAEILVHKAGVPSHLKGCIAPGFLEGKKLTLSHWSMEIIWEQCGGKAGVKNKQLEATFHVEGDMKPLKDCTPY